VHSAYALLLGVVMMRLSTRNFVFLRFAVVYIAFIWATSLILPSVLENAGVSVCWKERLRLLLNYFQRNFYQQVLFFILPFFGVATSHRFRYHTGCCKSISSLRCKHEPLHC